MYERLQESGKSIDELVDTYSRDSKRQKIEDQQVISLDAQKSVQNEMINPDDDGRDGIFLSDQKNTSKEVGKTDWRWL